jgi:prepilin-type processing-associated H-X9-DG protein
VPSRTPLFADSVWVFVRPIAADVPARNLYLGGNTPSGSIQRLTIARHGSMNPKSAPRNLPPGAPLPGSINIVFYDGHAQSVRLEDLWSIYWHKDYVPPAGRPR